MFQFIYSGYLIGYIHMNMKVLIFMHLYVVTHPVDFLKILWFGSQCFLRNLILRLYLLQLTPNFHCLCFPYACEFRIIFNYSVYQGAPFSRHWQCAQLQAFSLQVQRTILGPMVAPYLYPSSSLLNHLLTLLRTFLYVLPIYTLALSISLLLSKPIYFLLFLNHLCLGRCFIKAISRSI